MSYFTIRTIAPIRAKKREGNNSYSFWGVKEAIKNLKKERYELFEPSQPTT